MVNTNQHFSKSNKNAGNDLRDELVAVIDALSINTSITSVNFEG